jgi:hypothetical protein
MKNLAARTMFAVLLLMLGSLATAHAQITPIRDAYTNSAVPTTNFGTATTLGVANTGTSIQTTYIQFDLSSIPAGYTSANVAKATLKLYVNAVTTAGSFNVDFVNGSWTEKGITYNTPPALGSTIVSSVSLTSANVHGYLLIDVTAAVGDWLNGVQPNDGIALVANSPLNASVDSKENTSQSHPAELDIVFNGTITGINTAAGSGLTGGGNSGTLNLSLLTTCSSGQVLQWNGSSWVCSSAGTGTITGVTAGSGLSGGGNSGNVTLSVPSSGITNTMLQHSSLNVNAGTDLTGGGAVSLGSSTTLNLDTTKVPQLAGANTFTNNNVISVSNNSSPALKVSNSGSADGAQFTGGYDAAEFFGGVGGGIYADTHQDANFTAAIYANEWGTTKEAFGMWGYSASPAGAGIYGVGVKASTTGLVGPRSSGVWADTGGDFPAIALVATADNAEAIYAANNTNSNPPLAADATIFVENLGTDQFVLYASDVSGNGYVRTDTYGDLAAAGSITGASKNFKIDNPVDPANKYLIHTSVESPDMKTIYDGVAVLDADGEAWVELPAYFEALNQDFRYQLTAIGAPGPNLYISEKIAGNRFRIAGGKPGAEVSWQVTGIRHDAWANAHRSPVEVEKTETERGRYLHPEAFGLTAEHGVSYNGGANRRKLPDLRSKQPERHK